MGREAVSPCACLVRAAKTGLRHGLVNRARREYAMRIVRIALSLFILISLNAARTATQPPTADRKAWTESVEPFHIVGPIYYVGTRGLGIYLITTPAGHMLLNGGMSGSAPLIETSIRKLGYKPEEVKTLLISHAHMDHVGTLSDIKKLTRGQVEVISAEVELLESGGATDYLFAKDPKMHFAGVRADHVLKDGDTVSLGGVQLTARLTPGHTRGTTTWMTTVEDAGRSYVVVFPDGTTVNPGTHLVRNPSYPGITADYRRTLAFLATLHPDIYLAYHSEFFDPTGKRERAASEGVKAWVDPNGYARWIAEQTANFEKLVAQETAGEPTHSAP
jgi:metallo-beta-lactamase class B